MEVCATQPVIAGGRNRDGLLGIRWNIGLTKRSPDRDAIERLLYGNLGLSMLSPIQPLWHLAAIAKGMHAYGAPDIGYRLLQRMR
ncbi:MAG: hypothetical protein ACI8PT_004387 [Gammaproteobacteria bacterium]|jgi:hypothetical protein